MASISVDGSTDNFIVRITESAEATAAVEESLRNMYGSLDGLAYSRWIYHSMTRQARIRLQIPMV